MRGLGLGAWLKKCSVRGGIGFMGFVWVIFEIL